MIFKILSAMVMLISATAQAAPMVFDLVCKEAGYELHLSVEWSQASNLEEIIVKSGLIGYYDDTKARSGSTNLEKIQTRAVQVRMVNKCLADKLRTVVLRKQNAVSIPTLRVINSTAGAAVAVPAPKTPIKDSLLAIKSQFASGDLNAYYRLGSMSSFLAALESGKVSTSENAQELIALYRDIVKTNIKDNILMVGGRKLGNIKEDSASHLGRKLRAELNHRYVSSKAVDSGILFRGAFSVPDEQKCPKGGLWASMTYGGSEATIPAISKTVFQMTQPLGLSETAFIPIIKACWGQQ